MTLLIVAVVSFIQALICDCLMFWMFKQVLKGRIDPLAYYNPVPGFVVILTSWMPSAAVLTYVNGDPDGMALLGTPFFIAWMFVLKFATNARRGRIVRGIEVSQERKDDIGRTAAISDYLSAGGPM